MRAFNLYIYSTAGWLGMQGILLVTVPRIIVTLLLDDTRPPEEIETYFARSLGTSLLTISLLTIMLSGSVPFSSAVTEPTTEGDAFSDPRAPYSMPTLVVTSLFQAVCASYAYTWFINTSLAAFAVGVGGYAIISFLGIWCTLFAGSYSSSIGTGVDKRTSSYPFKNTEADKRKKVHVG